MINSHSHDMSDLQLEDVEDYTADYPPAGFPQSEENLHTSAVADSPPKYRTAKVVGILRSNKWLAGLMVIVVCIAISIVAIASGGPKEPKGGSSAGASSSGSTHQPPITVDPKSLDPRVTNALMNTLLSLYDRHGLDPSVLDDADSDATSAQKKAFFWLATDENLDNMDHTAKAQRFALACFYYATNAVSTPYTNKPQPWVSAHLWLSKSHVCEWRGIVCNEQQHVQAVDLERNNLSGSIPHEMTILASTLIELDLTSNLIYMEDDMFDAFESLDNLEILLMDDNYLGGDSGLPKQFQNMKKLQKLRLSYNLFAGELERDHKVLSNLGKLTHLEIESNFLTGTMPDVIGDMENLVYLYMRRNEMSYNLDFLKSGNLKNLCKCNTTKSDTTILYIVVTFGMAQLTFSPTPACLFNLCSCSCLVVGQ